MMPPLQSSLFIYPAQLNNNMDPGSYFYIFFYLFVVVLVLALLFWLRRYAMKRMSPVKSGRYMRVLDRVAIAQDKQIILLELQSRIAVIGVSGQSVNLLLELPREAIDELLPRHEESAAGFRDILGDAMKNTFSWNKSAKANEEPKE